MEERLLLTLFIKVIFITANSQGLTKYGESLFLPKVALILNKKILYFVSRVFCH